ncbi:MAG TPA: rhomboid family intramembrane serine protease, partial [Terriglobia bacterium]|nr:rhomboid family intramembrane serine protease [Terriglobia bacterium]
MNCGRWNPGMWGFAPVLTRFGRDMGFVPLVMTSCILLYAGSWVIDPRMGPDLWSLFSPSPVGLFIFGASGRAPVFEWGRWWTL